MCMAYQKEKTLAFRLKNIFVKFVFKIKNSANFTCYKLIFY